MSKDQDLERDLEHLMSRIELPEQERWVPTTARSGLRKPPWALGAAAAAVVVALAVGVASRSAPDVAASRSPLISPPLLTGGPLASPSPTSSVRPRGTAVVGPAGVIIDSKEEGFAAADDHALVVAVHESSRIVVTEFGGRKHTFEATRGRLAFLASHGALRGDLVAYTEVDQMDLSSTSPTIVWHIMVANWRTGAITELDAIPSEKATAPVSTIEYMPKVFTNGRDVIWLRAPRVNGELVGSELMLWRDGTTTVVYRGDVSYALADDGRIAIVQLQCPPGPRLGTCPTGTRWALSLLEGSSFTPRVLATRDLFRDPGAVGGPPAFAGNSIVWPHVSPTAFSVTSVDIVDARTGDTRTVTEEDCSWIGSTVREVVFSCPDSVLRVHPVAGVQGVTWSSEAGSRYLRADPHAIIGRRVDGGWVIRPVPD